MGLGGLSCFIHGALLVLLSLNPWPTKAHPMVYAVTLVPVAPAISEPLIAQPPPKEPTLKHVEAPKPVEKIKLPEKPKKDAIVEKVKKPVKPLEKPEEEDPSRKKLQEALEEIRRRAALDEIRRKVSRHDSEKTEEYSPVMVPSLPATPPPKSTVSRTATSKTPTPPSLSPSQLESKLNEYYSRVWAKVKEEWTIPENLIKDKVDLEAIIVIIIEKDGRIQESWFEKKSNNALYDQMAIRALKKADPLPPIPKELGENNLEIGIRFFPE
jgi:colicin import membrane protein